MTLWGSLRKYVYWTWSVNCHQHMWLSIVQPRPIQTIQKCVIPGHTDIRVSYAAHVLDVFWAGLLRLTPFMFSFPR